MEQCRPDSAKRPRSGVGYHIAQLRDGKRQAFYGDTPLWEIRPDELADADALMQELAVWKLRHATCCTIVLPFARACA